MSDTYVMALILLGCVAVAGWLLSLYYKRVDMVDTLWSLMFLLCALVFYFQLEDRDMRSWIILVLVQVWAIRLALHLHVRSKGGPEDRRYREIRANNEPGFEYKSLYLVFGLQAVLAWIISVPLYFALGPVVDGWIWLDSIALLLWIVGFLFEAVGDWQLVAFRKQAKTENTVLSSGLWRYTRHPNYFGEFCIWWAYYLFAIQAGGWWTIYAPLLMSFLLLRISGVGLMEKDISSRRPAYREYIEQTPAFFPRFRYDRGTGNG